jgi:hypothetical protein
MAISLNISNVGGKVPTAVRAQLRPKFNADQLLVNYLGHGSVDVGAGSGILNGSDPATLTKAVWASSGLTEPESQFVMDKNLVQYLFRKSIHH